MLTNLTKIYFKVVAATVSVGTCIVFAALITNFFGQLWIPGLLFLGCIALRFILVYSPPALIFSGVAACYTLIPFVGDMSIGKTAQDLHEKIKNLLENMLTAMALVMLFLFTFHIDSFSFSRKLSIAFLFGMGFAILGWYSTKVNGKTIVWKAVFLAGILTIAKASALLWPSPIHDTLGIYPGVVIDRSKIDRNIFRVAQTDADILTAREKKDVDDFVKLLNKFNASNPHDQLTSEELIAQRSSLLKKGAITEAQSLIIIKELERRNNTPTKKIINKTSEASKMLQKRLAGDPTPQICGSIVYNPGDHVGGVLLEPPAGCKTPFTVEITGSYSQSFSDGRYQIDAKTGLPVQSIPQYELAIMPVKDRSLFGIALINNVPVDSKIRYYGAVNLNINTPLKKNGYSAITGSLRVDFYN